MSEKCDVLYNCIHIEFISLVGGENEWMFLIIPGIKVKSSNEFHGTGFIWFDACITPH